MRTDPNHLLGEFMGILFLNVLLTLSAYALGMYMGERKAAKKMELWDRFNR